jgi:hypothetical protein
MITINKTDITPFAVPNEGKPIDEADARAEPETGVAEATGHPAVGPFAERAAPNKVAVDAGAEAAVVVEALVPNPANEIMGAEAGAKGSTAKDDENENGEAAVTAGTVGAAAATPKSPKATWVKNAPKKQK